MSKIKNVAAGIGLAAGLLVAAAPMVAFADGPTGSDTLDVEVNIATIISMRIVSVSPDSGTKTTTCDSRNVVTDPNTGEITDNGCTGDTQSVKVSLLPSSSYGTGASDNLKTDIYVSTNSADGYSLTLIDKDASNSLTTTGGDTIAAISSQPAGGTNPGWAVSIDSGSTWQAVPVSTGSAIVVKNYTPDPKAITNEDQSTIKYGIATSTDQATGVYSDTVVYTATAH